MRIPQPLRPLYKRLAPAVYVRWYNENCVPKKSSEETSEAIRRWFERTQENESLHALADEIAASEAARIQRLEEKVEKHTALLSILVTLAAGLAGSAVARGNAAATIGATLSFLLLLSAYRASASARVGTRFHTLQNSDIQEDIAAGDSLPAKTAARKFAYVEANYSRGAELNNLTHGIDGSLRNAAILLAVSAALLLVGIVDVGTREPGRENVGPSPTPTSSISPSEEVFHEDPE